MGHEPRKRSFPATLPIIGRLLRRREHVPSGKDNFVFYQAEPGPQTEGLPEAELSEVERKAALERLARKREDTD